MKLYMESKICPNCHKYFYGKPSDLAKCIFCSVKCRMENVRKKRKTYCKSCGIIFYPEKRSNRKDQQYCSQTCMGKDQATLDYDKSFLPEKLDFVDGFLLGDGSISKKYSHISWTVKYQEFSEHIKYNLQCYQPTSRQKYMIDSRCKKGGYISNFGRTKCHPDITAQRKRWYPDGKKIVPKDVSLSPESVLIWYLSDGTFIRNQLIILCTDGFTHEEVFYLVSRLQKIGINCKKTNSHLDYPRIKILQYSLGSFFKYIGRKSPIKCYDYKFKVDDFIVNQTPSLKAAQQIGIKYHRFNYLARQLFPNKRRLTKSIWWTNDEINTIKSIYQGKNYENNN